MGAQSHLIFFPLSLFAIKKKVQNSINKEYRGYYKEHVNNWQYLEIFLLRIFFLRSRCYSNCGRLEALSVRSVLIEWVPSQVRQ